MTPPAPPAFITPILAQAVLATNDITAILRPGARLSASSARENILLLGVLAGLALFLLALILLFNRRKLRRLDQLQRSAWPASASRNQPQSAAFKKNRRRKRRQHEQRTPNPSLAQTGGLPPKRDPGQPPAA